MAKHLVYLLFIILSFTACNNKKSFDYVDPFIGTGGHGHTFPGATLPFGMVQVSPDTRLSGWDGCSGYHYTDSIIYGFSHTHLSGTGVSDYGDILIMPYLGETHFDNGEDGKPGYRSEFLKFTEKAEPGYYSVELEKYNIIAELTATERVGFHKYSIHGLKEMKLMLDLEHRDEVLESEITQIDDYSISGYRHSKAWAQKQFVFFKIVFDKPIKSIEIKNGSQGKKAAISFGRGSELKVKVALSAVDQKGASLNLEKEIPHWNFKKVRRKARKVWQKQLDKIEVDRGTEKMKRIFYTALYHTMIAPNIFHDVDGRYRGTDLEIHQDKSFKNYTVFSLWDTYRSIHPLYTIIEKKRSNDFIQTFLKQYQNGGKLPVWELAANYTGCMIGYHSVSVIADAYAKGINNFDAQLALEAMLHSSNQNRLGIDHFRKNGFISADLEPESVSKTLEYAYDDWCIAEMANRMGKKEIATEYYQRAQYYKNVFDPQTGFMRARNNNRWFVPFDPAEVNFNYTEANAWQYSFYVPQDVNSWMYMLGGDKALEQKLDDLFNASSETSGRDQADITGLIGQYAHGNEPSHHIPYLYNFVGRPDKTQDIVRQIMNELYSDEPNGLVGNEDCGQMSSWFVMSAMGFYPLAPGSSNYILGSPLFKKVKINLENGKSFLIKAPRNSRKNRFVSNIELNGKSYPFTYLKHEDILSGGEIKFDMASKPSEFGRKPEQRPISNIRPEILPIPALVTGEHAFMDSTLITISNASYADIYYSFDKENKKGLKYMSPFSIHESCSLYVWSKTDNQTSKIAKSEFYKIPKKRSIDIVTNYANHYKAGGDNALIDFIRGGKDFQTGAWQGYQGVDLEAIVDLGKVEEINTIEMGFLQDENAWIFMPTEVEFMISEKGKEYKSLGKVKSDISYKDKGAITRDIGVELHGRGRYIKVMAKNRGICPAEHKGAGEKSWIFADEILIK